jgi:hypothetical protein
VNKSSRTETNLNKNQKYIKRTSSTIIDEARDEESSEEEEEEESESDDEIDNAENYYFYNEDSKKAIDNIYFTSHCLPKPIPISSTNSQREHFIFEDKLHQRTLQIDPLNFIDQPIQMISPINTNTRLYPQSTRNHFNIDMTTHDTQTQIHNQNIFRKSKINFNTGISTLSNSDLQQILYFPPNKEITLHNKILINDVSMEANSTPNFKDSKNEIPENEKELILDEKSISFKEKMRNKLIRPSIDLNLINDNDLSKMFTESVLNSVKTLNNLSHINFEYCQDFSKDVDKELLNNNMQDKEKEKENISEGDLYGNENSSNSANVNVNFNSNNKPIISPQNVRAFFNISPKSAFMKIN